VLVVGLAVTLVPVDAESDADGAQVNDMAVPLAVSPVTLPLHISAAPPAVVVGSAFTVTLITVVAVLVPLLTCMVNASVPV
jgi:hypothetical protein